MITEGLITISGANRTVLAQIPQERTKQAAMGAVLLTTAVIAAVAAAYAFHVALHLWVPVAVLAGCAWGLMILNLDRWLVVSTPRLRSWVGNVVMALPRVALAVLIGTVISTPLTLAVFGAEIGTELEVMAAEEEAAFTQQLATDPRFADLPEEEQQVAELQAEIDGGFDPAAVTQDARILPLQQQLDADTAEIRELARQVACEVDGSCGSGQRGAGPALALKQGQLADLQARAAGLQEQINTLTPQVAQELQANHAATVATQEVQVAALQAEVDSARGLREAAVEAHAEAVEGGGGLLARLEALERIQDGNASLATAHLLLFLLMTALECLPIIFKTLIMLAPESTYERLVRLAGQNAEERVRLRMQADIEEAQTIAGDSVRAAEARAAATVEAEARATRMVLDAQLDVTEANIARWRQRELATLDLTSTTPAGPPAPPAPRGAFVV